MPPFFSPAGISVPNPGTLWAIAQALGLDGNMQMCFDAADSASLAGGSDQTFVNRGAGGRDLTLGADTAVSTDDPQFEGAVGSLSAAARFNFDGGDFFRQTSPGSSLPTWMNNLHKDNALWFAAFWVYMGTVSAANGLFGTYDGNTSATGVYLRILSGRTLNLLVGKGGGGTDALNATSTITVPTGQWSFVAVKVDEAAGSGTFQINGTQESFTSTYTAPASGGASAPMRVGSSGGTSARFQSGNKLNGFWLRGGTGTTDAELMAIYKRSRQRPGF